MVLAICCGVINELEVSAQTIYTQGKYSRQDHTDTNIDKNIHMNTKLLIGGIVAAVVLLAVIIFGGGSSTVRQAQVGEAFFATFVSEQRTDGVISPGQDSFEVTGRAESFTTDEPEIYAVVELSSIAEGSLFEYRWIDLDENQVIFSEKRAETPQFYPFRRAISKLSRNTQTWDAGSYQFQLWQNGVMLTSRNFTVKTPSQSRLDQLKAQFPRIELAREVGLDGRVKDKPTLSFTQDDKIIYASVDYQDIERDTVFTAKWTSLADSKTLKTYTRDLTDRGTFSFSLDATRDLEVAATRFPKGRYQLIISVDATELGKITFEVQ